MGLQHCHVNDVSIGFFIKTIAKASERLSVLEVKIGSEQSKNPQLNQVVSDAKISEQVKIVIVDGKVEKSKIPYFRIMEEEEQAQAWRRARSR